MDEMKWELLIEIQGRLEAELVESFLEAHGIDVELFQEAVGHTIYPVTVDGLGLVQVFVAKSRIEEARQLLEIFQKGTEGVDTDE